MLKKVRAICSLLCICTVAAPLKYQYKTLIEHNYFKPAHIDAYWKYAQGDEKTVTAVCTDSNS